MKKKTLIIALSILVISIFSVSTTIAFLSARDTSDNVFTIGNVEITLTESETNELGKKTGDEINYSNRYHLMPGYTYTKDPTVTVNNGSADSYVRMLITMNNISELKNIYGNDFTLEDIFSNWGSNWKYENEVKNTDGTITYEYRYKNVVNGENGDNKLEPIFTTFGVPGEATIEDLKNIEDLEITVKAQAIQKSGFNNDDEAWEGFKKQYNE